MLRDSVMGKALAAAVGALAGVTIATAVAVVFGLPAPMFALALALSAGLGLVIGGAVAALEARRLRRRGTAQALGSQVAALEQAMRNLEGRVAAAEQRAQQAPALVWRAASADIETLSTLVTQLARSVAELERRLEALATAPPPAAVAAPGATAPASPAPNAAQPERADAAPDPAFLAMLDSPALEFCLQPIVTLPQRKTVAYHGSLRHPAASGEALGEQALRQAAMALGQVERLDERLIERATGVLRILRARGRSVMLAIGVDPATIASGQLRAFLDREPTLAASLRLEIGARDFRHLRAQGGDALRAVAAAGARWQLRDLPSLPDDLEALRALGVDIVAMEAATLIAALDQPEAAGAVHAADWSQLLARHGMQLLVTQVIDERMVLDALDADARLASGPLFGGMRPVRPEVLEPRPVTPEPTAPAPTTPSPAPPTTTAAPAAEGGEGRERPRVSYRALLRRA